METPKSGAVLAFDFGLQRIGVAQGEFQAAIAHPLCTIQGNSNQDKFQQIAQLIHTWQPIILVLGLPCHLDGQAHEMTAACERFARRLNGRFGLPVSLIDERLTSALAQSMLAQAHVFGKKQKKVLDQVAAATILQTFFDEGSLAIITTYQRHQQPTQK